MSDREFKNDFDTYNPAKHGDGFIKTRQNEFKSQRDKYLTLLHSPPELARLLRVKALDCLLYTSAAADE